jgi:hypothetical protein
VGTVGRDRNATVSTGRASITRTRDNATSNYVIKIGDILRVYT